MKSARETARLADELDARRQHQITNQIESINRLLEDGAYGPEMAQLHQELVDVQTRLDDALAELKQLREAQG